MRQHQEERGQADQDAVAAIHERPFVGLRQNPNADIIDSVRKALVTKTSELPNVPPPLELDRGASLVVSAICRGTLSDFPVARL